MKSKLSLSLVVIFCLSAATTVWAQDPPTSEPVTDTEDSFYKDSPNNDPENPENSDSYEENTEALDEEIEPPLPENIEEKPEVADDAKPESVIEADKEPLPMIRRKRESVEVKKEGTRYINHPNAEKGLIKITKDKTYIYKVETSPQTRASSVRFGLYTPTELENEETGTGFEENYDDNSMPMVIFDYEWQIWRGALGKFGLTAGSGLYVTNGHGRFKNPSLNPGLEPKEVFTFILLPNAVGAVYRMQFMDKQIIVPYASGGGLAFVFSEIRDDDKGPKFGGAFGAYAAGGIALSLNFLEPSSMFDLDREYGINSVYLAAEYRYIVGLSTYDFTSDMINAGLLVEF